jgi:hypothetical protein
MRSKNSLSSLCTALFADIAGRTTVSSKLLLGIPCRVVESGDERAVIDSQKADFAGSDLIRPHFSHDFVPTLCIALSPVFMSRPPQGFDSPVSIDFWSWSLLLHQATCYLRTAVQNQYWTQKAGSRPDNLRRKIVHVFQKSTLHVSTTLALDKTCNQQC